MTRLVTLATLLLLLCSTLTAQSPIVRVVTLDNSFVALHADGSLTEGRADGSVIELSGPDPDRAGRILALSTKLSETGHKGTSFDYTLPEDNAYKVHQDCANMSLKACIKRFRAAIVELRVALGY